MHTARRQRRIGRCLALAALLGGSVYGCGESTVSQPAAVPPAVVTSVAFYVDPAVAALMTEWANGLQPMVTVAAAPDPVAAVRTGAADALSVAIVPDLECGECYRLERTAGGWVVHGGAPLGVQYGATDVLEQLGCRFFHPWETHVPAQLVALDAPRDVGKLFTPERALRGLHLHTLHPIESFFNFWVPGDAGFEGARRTIDWIVKNRGNYVQWAGLDQYQRAPANIAAWQAHTKRIVDYAHSRGVKIGFAIELFGSGDLQLAFDLLDTASDIANASAVIHNRLATVLPDLGFDRINLSFGEFFGTDPNLFINTTNLTLEAIQDLAPGVEMTATIHVGDPKKLSVTYDGQTMLYYFLVQFADPRIVPWVHTVMYYELFGDAGGAYNLDNFSEHSTFLLQRLQNGQRVGFFPESAYWITFDDPVPTYTPVYMRSRWRDYTDIDQHAAVNGSPSLNEHVEFSSGWEWGYWQNDYATLRMGYTLPKAWNDTVDDMFSPWGAAGAALAQGIATVGNLEHDYLIGRRLAPYVASRDALLDLGEQTGIRSQPYRPPLKDVAAYDAGTRQQFTDDVLTPLGELVSGLGQVVSQLQGAGLPADDPWISEQLDGIEVTYQRARFIHAVYGAAVAVGASQPTQPLVDEAAAAFAAARALVTHRHSHLHDPNPQQILATGTNATTYPFGYLYYADQLCYWQRERAQLAPLLGEPVQIPSCFSVTLPPA